MYVEANCSIYAGLPLEYYRATSESSCSSEHGEMNGNFVGIAKIPY